MVERRRRIGQERIVAAANQSAAQRCDAGSGLCFTHGRARGREGGAGAVGHWRFRLVKNIAGRPQTGGTHLAIARGACYPASTLARMAEQRAGVCGADTQSRHVSMGATRPRRARANPRSWRRRLCGHCVAPRGRVDRTTAAGRIRSQRHRAGRGAGGDRQLQRLPHGAGRHVLRRRSVDADAVWNDLRDQHHPGSGNRYRRLVGGRRSGAPYVSGVARDGHHLYPVFPYDHFIDVNDVDAHALYAFLMTRAPVTAPPCRTICHSRSAGGPVLAVWKLLYLRHDAFKPDASQSADWNRGGYLVEGLAHCGACHTPRNAEGAEKRDQKFAGGSSEGWNAPALNAASPAPLPWTAEQLFAYLRHGVDDQHGAPPDRWRRSRTIWRACPMPTCARSQPMWRAWRSRRHARRQGAGTARNARSPARCRPPQTVPLRSSLAPAPAVTRVHPGRWRSILRVRPR